MDSGRTKPQRSRERHPSWVIPSLDGGHFYVSARLGDSLSVVSIEQRKEIARVKVGDYPQRMWTMRFRSVEPPIDARRAEAG